MPLKQAFNRLFEDLPDRAIQRLNFREFVQLLVRYKEGWRVDLYSTILSRKMEGHTHVGKLRLVRGLR